MLQILQYGVSSRSQNLKVVTIFLSLFNNYKSPFITKLLSFSGYNMVCSPEHNYNVHWPLGVYGTFVSVPCPRKSNGKNIMNNFII